MSGQDEGILPDGGDDLLAAEYVLGVLPSSTRDAVTKRISSERGFARLVSEWEARLEPLNDDYVPVAPSSAAKKALDARLFGNEAKPASGIWQSLAFWRGLTLGALALAAFVIVPEFFMPVEPVLVAAAQIIAPMQSDTGEVKFVALYQPGSDELRISKVKSNKGADRDYELWLVDDGGKPQSMGVIPDKDEVVLKVKPEFVARINAGDAFAVSVEPLGGSPTGTATGPVIAVGVTKSI